MSRRLLTFLTWLSLALVLGESSPTGYAAPADEIATVGSFVYAEIARFGGDMSQVVEAGDFAYAVIGADFVVFDVSAPAAPAVLYREDIIPGEIPVKSMDVSGGYVYLLEKTGTLDIIDVRTPASPVFVAQTPLSVPMRRLNSTLIAGNLYLVAYETDSDLDITLVDVSDPLHPLQRGTYETSQYHMVGNMAARGNYVYVVTLDSSLLILDISDPDSPVEAATYTASSSTVALALQGDYLYLNEGGSHLKILELTQPLSPKEVGTYNGVFDEVSVDGQHAYLLDFFDDPPTVDVVNVATPSAPVSEGITTLPAFYADHLRGSALYLADNVGWSRWDFAASPALVQVRLFEHVVQFAKRVQGKGDYLFVASGANTWGAVEPKKLWVIDVSSPAAPTPVASAPLPDEAQWIADLDVQGTLAAVTEPTGVHLIDITSPLSPTLLATVNASLLYRTPHTVLTGTYLYTGDEDSTYVVDVSSPMTPTEVISFTDTDAWGAFDIQGNLAYANTDREGFRIFDISDPTNPVQQGSIFVAPYVYDLAVSGDYAYLGVYNENRVYVVDVSSPSNPSVVRSVVVPDENRIYRLGVASGELWVYGKSGDAHLYDLSVPDAPVHLGVLSFAFDVFVSGDLRYVACGRQGVRVMVNLPYRAFLPLAVR